MGGALWDHIYATPRSLGRINVRATDKNDYSDGWNRLTQSETV
jgi:hypothetical protein